jgi:hypothetical protein
MAYPYTTLTISYGSSSTATLNLPANSNVSDYVSSIFKNFGFWIQQDGPTPATQTFVPASAITSIVAQ